MRMRAQPAIIQIGPTHSTRASSAQNQRAEAAPRAYRNTSPAANIPAHTHTRHATDARVRGKNKGGMQDRNSD